MLPALRRSFPLGNELNVSALRSRMFSSAKLLILASAAVMSGLAPSTSLAQSTVAAKPSLSPQTMALHRLVKRPVANLTAPVDVAESSSGVNSEQGFGALARDKGHPGCDLFPAPANIGTNVGLSYFGPPPSTVNQSLVGPVQLLNTGQLDATPGTITIPLYKGTVKSTGKTAWYILTDVSDQGIAQELGLNFSAKMKNINTAARTGNLGPDGNIIFDKGTVNFAPERNIVPGPEGAEFPPKSFTPGEIGDANYSPYVTITNGGGVVYNAPMIAYDVDASDINFPNGHVDYTKVHDAVQAIDPINMTVTLALVNGFSFGRPVWYITMDASIPLAAAIEHNTYAPLMGKLLLGNDDSAGSPIERIFIATNGTEGCDNPQRQGLSADLNDGHRPNNTLGGIPTLALDYSPAWDANLYTWTDEAISKGYRQQLREEFQILTYAQDGLITGASATQPFGSAGFSINCPIVQRLD
ncbi:MAG TPA: hypothetical protein VN901_29390 [Candidatus Acidoferrales bacterium]|nr:hypothetical protein [Candidatus Acidoferrales bacterium]